MQQISRSEAAQDLRDLFVHTAQVAAVGILPNHRIGGCNSHQ
jgi:hypothetical protein